MKLLNDKDYKKLKDSKRFEENEISIFGTKIIVPDSPSFFFFIKDFFELEIYKFRTLNKQPIIIDCGANIGISIIYFKKLYPNSKIIAFEPDRKIFQTLEHNINAFKFNNITLINKALWDIETTLDFYSEGGDGGRISEHGESNLIKVETVLLSKFIRNNEIDFLKIDIEGAEHKVLKEIEPYLKNIKNLFIEYHSFSDKKQTLSEILGILTNNGFRYYIESIGLKNHSPLISIKKNGIFDNQLNIFANRFKEHD